MKKKLTILSLGALFLISFVLTSCTVLNPFSNKDKDQTIYYGTAEAEKIDISAEVAGRVKEVKVQEGEIIKSGSLIAVLNTPENTIKSQQAETSVKNAENELAKLNEGSRQEEIKAQEAVTQQAVHGVKQAENAFKQADANLTAAQATYAFKEKIFNNTKILYESNAVPKQELDNDAYVLDTAKSALTNAQYAQDTAKQQIESAKSQLTAAREKLNLLKNGATEKTKNTAKYGIAQAKQGYSLSKLLLDKANIVALSEGVIESVNYSVGEYVTPGNPVVTMVNPQNMWVKIFVPEKVLPLIKVNKIVKVKSDFLKDKIIKGRISYIATEAEFTPLNIVTKNDRMKLVYAVKIQLLDHLQEIKPGMLLDIDLDDQNL
jgi:HlyD family secretion protein